VTDGQTDGRTELRLPRPTRADFDSGAQSGGATWRVTVNNSLRRRLQACICIWPISLCENVTSSAKRKIRNALHCGQRRTEPWPRVTCTENFVKAWRVAVEICERTDTQTDRQTDRHTDRNTSHHFRGQNNKGNIYAILFTEY